MIIQRSGNPSIVLVQLIIFFAVYLQSAAKVKVTKNVKDKV
jgi:hypothetical protein